MKNKSDRIILDIDSPNHNQLKRAIDQSFRSKGMLYLPNNTFDCQGCGKPTNFKNAVEYFGQCFCEDCVDKWRHGHK